MTKITCFIATEDLSTRQELLAEPLVEAVHYRAQMRSSEDMTWIAANANAEYTLITNPEQSAPFVSDVPPYTYGLPTN